MMNNCQIALAAVLYVANFVVLKYAIRKYNEGLEVITRALFMISTPIIAAYSLIYIFRLLGTL